MAGTTMWAPAAALGYGGGPAAAAAPLISTSALSDLLAAMQARMVQQDAVIAELRERVDALTAADTGGALRAVDGRLAAVEASATYLLAHTHVGVGGPPTVAPPSPGSPAGGPPTLGALMAATAARVVQLETTAATSLATRAGVEAAVAGLEARAEARLAAVADGCATRGALAALTAATTALSESLTATQGVVSTKVDRADLLRLQTTAAELASFAEWKAATAAGLADVSSRAADTRTALDAAVDSIATLSNVTNALAASLDAKADGGALDAVAASATAAARVAADAAPASALAGVAAGLAAMTHRVGAVEGRARDGRAGAGAATASRAYVVSLEATDENVTAAQAALDALASKVEVCLRFVEWFAEKGEAYEYNASALERHMNALAVGNRSTPRDRARGVASDLSASYVAASRGGGGGGGAAAAPLVGVPGVRIGGIAP